MGAFGQGRRDLPNQAMGVFPAGAVVSVGHLPVTGHGGRPGEVIQDIGKDGAQPEGVGVTKGRLPGKTPAQFPGRVRCHEPMGYFLGHGHLLSPRQYDSDCPSKKNGPWTNSWSVGSITYNIKDIT